LVAVERRKEAGMGRLQSSAIALRRFESAKPIEWEADEFDLKGPIFVR
jgi:hypothetical protein